MNTCNYIFIKGKRKGQTCNLPIFQNTDRCFKHIKTDGNIPIIRITDQSNSTIIEEDALRQRILNLDTSAENKSVILKHYNNMKRVDPNSTEYYKNNIFVDLALSYPWKSVFDINDILKTTDIKTFIYYIKTSFDNEIYGMEYVKDEIINLVCKMITNPHSNRNNIALYGAAGVGKSKFIKILSDVLGIPMKVISLGGIKDSSFFLGHGYVYVESNPGKILQNIIDSKVQNPIIYFDELDKISDNGRDIHSFLSYLTDPTQNTEFTDHYFYGMKFDLSKVLYVFTFNDISRVDKILLDRLNIIHINTPTDDEIITILYKHCIPEIIKNIGIKYKIYFSHEQIQSIIKHFKNSFDKTVSSGVREYYRIIEKILLFVNRDILLQDTSCLAQLDDSNEQLSITDTYFNKYLDLIKQQIKKDETEDISIQHMYL